MIIGALITMAFFFAYTQVRDNAQNLAFTCCISFFLVSFASFCDGGRVGRWEADDKNRISIMRRYMLIPLRFCLLRTEARAMGLLLRLIALWVL
jgi:hypothetical protein